MGINGTMYAGSAVHDGMPGEPSFEGAGGGMSASENRMVNYRGRTLGKGGGPKSTSHGADLGKGSTNVKMRLGHNPKEVSPSPSCQSRNYQGSSKRKY